MLLFGGEVFRTAIVAASDLPRDRSTLLVRLMAGGPLLSQAIPELAVLPKDAPERAVAEKILLDLKKKLGQKPKRSRKEQEFIMTMQSTWEDARELGRVEARAGAVLDVLRVRGIPVPKDVQQGRRHLPPL